MTISLLPPPVQDSCYYALDTAVGTLVLVAVVVLSFGGLLVRVQIPLLYNKTFAKLGGLPRNWVASLGAVPVSWSGSCACPAPCAVLLRPSS